MPRWLLGYERSCRGFATGLVPSGDQYSGLDAFGRVVETRWKKASAVKQEVNYGYDRASNRTWRRNELAHTLSNGEEDRHDNFYRYDGLYQVIERQLGGLTGTAPNYSGITNKQQDEDWCYDETGNWQRYGNEAQSNLEQLRTHNQANEICSVSNPGGVVQPAYDPVGNQTVDIAPGDWTKQYDLTWDAWNRLVRVEDNATAIQTNAYDGLTRRITSKDQNDDVTHYYYNDQWRAVEEYKNSETSPARRYLWGLRSRWDLVKRLRDAAGDLDEERYVLYDAMDPVAICDETGAVKLRFEYSPFGEVTFLDEDFVPIEGASGSSSSSSSSEEPPETWNWLFHGEFRDEETGYYNYGFRSYNPQIGRFVNRDIIEELGGSNLYAFAANDGVNRVDVFGLYGPMPGYGPGWDDVEYMKPMTCERAKEIVSNKVDQWRKQGYHFAADLLDHFLNGDGNDYTPTDANVQEVSEQAKSKLCKRIESEVCKNSCGTTVNVSIEPEDEDDSNVRWYYLFDNKNMLNAYGGARMSASGTAKIESDCRWSGTFAVTLKDLYEFDKKEGATDELKQGLSSAWSYAYSAAVYLEQNCGRSTFSHQMHFSIDCSGCCPRLPSGPGVWYNK